MPDYIQFSWNSNCTLGKMAAVKLLIADDSVDLLELMDLFLSEKGYEVKCASNKKLLFNALKNYVPDVIILDVFIDNVDGRELCKKLRSEEKTKNTPIIIFSANPYAIANYKSFGANDFIEKPFSLENVVVKIQSVLQTIAE